MQLDSTAIFPFFSFIRWKRPLTIGQVEKLYGTLTVAPRYYALVFAILLSSQVWAEEGFSPSPSLPPSKHHLLLRLLQFLATSILMYHNRVWFFSESDPPAV